MADQPRRPGRPPLDDDDPSVQVCVSLPGARYDELYDRAQRDRVSVPEVIRRQLDADKKYPK